MLGTKHERRCAVEGHEKHADVGDSRKRGVLRFCSSASPEPSKVYTGYLGVRRLFSVELDACRKREEVPGLGGTGT
jgi:hypothetical protein